MVKNDTEVTCRPSRVCFHIHQGDREHSKIFFRCFLWPMRRNTVSSGFNFSLFDDIQFWTEARQDWSLWMHAEDSLAGKATYNWLSSAYKWWGIEWALITLLSGVVYRVNRKGPMSRALGNPEWKISTLRQCATNFDLLVSITEELNQSRACP